MLEHAHVFGNFYGSPQAPVRGAIEAGCDVLFDIDWQGAQQIRNSAAARTCPVDLPAAALDRANCERRLRSPRSGQRRDHRQADAEKLGRDQPLGRLRLCADQRRSGHDRGPADHHRHRRAAAPRHSSPVSWPMCAPCRRNSRRNDALCSGRRVAPDCAEDGMGRTRRPRDRQRERWRPAPRSGSAAPCAATTR